MKLLILTQKVDRNEPILGFFHRWIIQFSKSWEQVIVICLREGEHNLPENVSVYSLGKEQGRNKLQILFNFYRYIWRERKNYDSVFVHMNQEYVLLAGVLWRLMGKKVGFWYNHTAGSILTKIAMLLSNVVFHTSPYAYTAHAKKSQKMPAGIDTNLFKPQLEVDRSPNSLLFVGRIAPIKGVFELIQACQKLYEQNIDFSLDVYGEALPKDKGYEERCKKLAEDLPVTLHGSVLNTELPTIYASHDIFINLTPAGNYDKTVLEAMACGTIPVVSSEAFGDILGGEYMFEEGSVRDLANKLGSLSSLSLEKRYTHRREFIEYVKEHHSLQHLGEKLTNTLCKN